MRVAALLAVLAVSTLPMLGCKHSRLEGHWKGAGVEGVAPEAQKIATDFATGMELEFKKDTLTIHTSKDTQTGKFTVVKDEKSAITIHADKDDPNDPSTFTFVDDATMKWTLANGKPAAITFKKQ
jgi:hypothetical protein